MKKHYYLCKSDTNGTITYVDFSTFNNGFNINPKNSIKYDGVEVNKMVIINPSMIEKLLKRKIKRKLELYLKIIMAFIDSEDADPGMLSEALNDLNHYKSIIEHKYKKYLDERFLSLLNKKISIVEYELNNRMSLYEVEEEFHRTR